MKYFLCALALSLGVANAATPPNMTNQTFDGQNIKAGTYFGTTTFINSAESGINLAKGTNIRGAMGVGAGTDGGNIIIQAPTQVVKLDGNIDVKGLPSTGIMQGNGGSVTVNAAYLFQNGNIYASGFRGGSVTMNVGGMTMASGSLIDAHSFSTGGQQPGGVVTINSPGQVDIQNGAKIDVSGSPNWAVNNDLTNLMNGFNNIVIQGSAVNMNGVLQASGVKYIHPQNVGFEENGGGIRLVASNGDVNIGSSAIMQADSANGISHNDRSIVVTASNDVNNNGLILAAGSTGASSGGPGGRVEFSAGHDINHNGRIVVDGGNGTSGWFAGKAGDVTLTAQNAIVNNGVIRAMGGNTDPNAAPAFNGVVNNGGDGGNVTFTGANPSGTGVVATFGGVGVQNGALGTITAPDPVNSTNTLYGVWKKAP